MTPKIALACLFILPLTIFCQEVVVEHLGYQGTTNEQKEEYNRHINTIKNSFNQAKKFLDENKNCESVQKCDQLLAQANNLMDYYNSENFEAKIARDKINNRIDAMNKYYENIGVGAHIEHDEIYERNEKYYLRHLKFRIGGFKFKINQLKSKKKESKSVSVSKSNEDFWNGNEKTKQPSKPNTNQIAISKGELEIIEGEENLRRKGSSVLVFPEKKFIGFKKLGEYFIAQVRLESKNNQLENIKRYNRTYLFDKNGDVLLKSKRFIYFNNSKTEIHALNYESIVYSHSVDGGYFPDVLVYKVKEKHEIYDLEMNLKSIENISNDRNRTKL